MYLQVYKTSNLIIFELLNTWIHEFWIFGIFSIIIFFFHKCKLIEKTMVAISEMLDW